MELQGQALVLFVCAYACVRVRACVFACVCTCVCVRVCVGVHSYIRTHVCFRLLGCGVTVGGCVVEESITGPCSHAPAYLNEGSNQASHHRYHTPIAAPARHGEERLGHAHKALLLFCNSMLTRTYQRMHQTLCTRTSSHLCTNNTPIAAPARHGEEHLGLVHKVLLLEGHLHSLGRGGDGSIGRCADHRHHRHLGCKRACVMCVYACVHVFSDPRHVICKSSTGRCC